uniref:Phorbol-ester/DAG-type domain-containing protein n=1 Tax=Populus trichocarpa TaxID=3694 RepID=A0A2K1R6B9_POPTR
MEVEHFSHPDHPLILINQALEYSCEVVICSGCEGQIWGPCYSCTSCYFFLHKKCAELPREIKRRIHRTHPLHLLAKPPSHYTRCFCDRCYKTCNSFVYHCSFCKFDLDIKCAFQPGFLEVDSQAHQFAHKDHPLILNEEQEYHGEGVVCSLCKEPMSGPSYSCTSCNFFLHKKCAELPPEIKRHIHPEHPLRLLPNHHMICGFCKETCYESFVYCCFVCEFNLHIKCAFPPCVYAADQDQGHQFRSLLNPLSLKSISFTCNACGTERDDSPFMCTTCQLLVHEECISLPRTLKTALHHHPRIIHTYQHQQCIESINKYCGICRLEVDSKYGVYYCPDCDFVAHVNCSVEYGDFETEIVEENEEEQSVTVDDQFMEPSFRVVREIKHGEERIIEEIEHFSHQHNLILIDKVDDDLKCEGCMLPISTPFYRLSIDVRCFKSLKDSFKHGGHEHPLYLPADRKNILRCSNIGGSWPPPLLAADGENIPHCSGCCVSEESKVFFKCVVCDFKLGMKCATLPYKARHEYDDHPLFLTYINANDYQPSCIICEKDRDPKLWFYRCEECDFDAHPECALGKYPYVKPGGVHTYPKHPHPIALVDKTEDYRPQACDTCGEPCDDLALECTDPNCSFIVHRKRWQCFQSLLY